MLSAYAAAPRLCLCISVCGARAMSAPPRGSGEQARDSLINLGSTHPNYIIGTVHWIDLPFWQPAIPSSVLSIVVAVEKKKNMDPIM